MSTATVFYWSAQINFLRYNCLAEPWSSDAVMYQPYEVEQILLAENASCLAAKTFLNVNLFYTFVTPWWIKKWQIADGIFQMCHLEYKVEPCANAEYMSPGGHMTKLPVLQCGAFVVAELEPIIHLVEKKGVSLTSHLDADEKQDLRAYLCLTEKIFTNAEVCHIKTQKHLQYN